MAYLQRRRLSRIARHLRAENRGRPKGLRLSFVSTSLIAAMLIAVVAQAPAPNATQAAHPHQHQKAPGWKLTSGAGTWATQFAGYQAEGISCLAGTSFLTSFCIVVGVTSNSGTSSALALTSQTTTGGVTGWSPLTAGLSGADALSGVSCTGSPSSWACMAVGGGGSQNTTDVVTITSSSSTWALQTAPTNIVGSPEAVGCLSATTCVVSGRDSSGYPVLDQTTDGGSSWANWGGSTWEGSSSSTAAVHSISCVPETGDCYATIETAGPSTSEIVASSGGGSWTLQTPVLANSLSCVAANPGDPSAGDDCWAVAGGGLVYMLGGTPSNGSWASDQNPMSFVTMVSCASAADCWVVGMNSFDYTTIEATTNAEDAAQTSNFDTWSSQDTNHVPAVDVVPGLDGLACVPTSGGGSCWLATSAGILATVDGGAFWAQQTYNLTDPTQVTCPDPSQPMTCFAIDANSVVRTTDGGAVWLPLAVVRDQSKGSFVAYELSCASVLACAVIGYYQTSVGDNLAVFSTIDGGTTWWQVSNTSLAVGPDYLSCPPGQSSTSTSCWGYGMNSAGTSIMQQFTLGPDGSASTALSSLSGTDTSGSIVPIIGSGDIACLTAQECWLAVYGGIWVTTGSWTQASTHEVLNTVNIGNVEQLFCLSSASTPLCWAAIQTGASTTAIDGAIYQATNATNASSWTAANLSSALVDGESVNGISCWDASDCAAYGSIYTPVQNFTTTKATSTALIQESGGSWSAPSPSYPSDSTGILSSISCAGSEDSCIAVGTSTVWLRSGSQFTDGGDGTGAAEVVSTNGIASSLLGVANIWETYGGFNPAQPCLSCLANKLGLSPYAFGGDPVNTATGAFHETYTPISIPGRGVPLQLSFTYDSSLAEAQVAAGGTPPPLGYGWTYNYQMGLSFPDSGFVQVNQGAGAEALFQYDTSTGDYVAFDTKTTATLTYDSLSLTYTFAPGNGLTKYTFSSSGVLQSIEDLNGNGVTLTSTTTNCPTGDTCTAVTDAGGRTLTLVYSAGSLIEAIDPAGRTVTFTVSGNKLQDFIDPASAETQFCYTSTSGELTTIIPPNASSQTCSTATSDILTNVYNAAGQVESQTGYVGNVTTFSYTGDPLGPDGGTTTVTVGNGTTTPYQETAYEYVSGERIAVVYDANGGSGTQATTTTPTQWTYSYQQTVNGTTCYGQSLDLPTSITNPDGQTTSMCYDSLGDMVEKTDAVGNTSTWTYTGQTGSSFQGESQSPGWFPALVADPRRRGERCGGIVASHRRQAVLPC